jgi:hypothetical protein
MVVTLARQATSAGRPVQKPYAGVNYIYQSGTMNLATEMFVYIHLDLDLEFGLWFNVLLKLKYTKTVYFFILKLKIINISLFHVAHRFSKFSYLHTFT